MSDDLKLPSFEATQSVFKKIGVDPDSRLSMDDQDYEYTSCSVSELDQYINLYQLPSTTDQEKRVLGCFLLQCLNDHYQEKESKHTKFSFAMQLLVNDLHIHRSELAYWTDTADSNPDHWWPITKPILTWLEKNA